MEGTTPRGCGFSVRSPWDNGPVLIGCIVTPLTMRHSGSLEILNKRQSISSNVSRNNQHVDASSDGNLANEEDSTSIFRKVLGRELSDSLSADIYLRCWLEFTDNAVGNKVPNFVHLGLPAVNALDEFNTLW